MHTLVLIGELNRSSAATLEAEIERACMAGAEGITLDLAELTGIDASGVAVLVFRCGWCRRRGCQFALISASAAVRGAFERAGTIEELTFVSAEEAWPPVAAKAAAAALREPTPAPARVGAMREPARDERAAPASLAWPARSSSVLRLGGQRPIASRSRRRRRRRR
jgi:anti-anti-sigma factor